MPYKPGDHWVQCDQCGFKRYASDCRKTWNGLFVCADTCWEEKHPALIPRKLFTDKQVVTNIRKPADIFIEPPEVEP
jgi:hypothetical protein